MHAEMTAVKRGAELKFDRPMLLVDREKQEKDQPVLYITHMEITRRKQLAFICFLCCFLFFIFCLYC